MKIPQFLIAKRKQLLLSGLVAGTIVVIGLLLPQDLIIPVKGAAPRDWNPNSWWAEPWGVSGVHKGIDIFAPERTPVLAPTSGLVIYEGQMDLGGNVVCILGPKWRVHFFAHLNRSQVWLGQMVATGEQIGEVGRTGNAQGKAPHLHYQIETWIPYPWRWDGSTQGWKKMFILNPQDYLPRSGPPPNPSR
ncbi:MAG TPA: M23 family metallopeptidase [Blastocatellia bacterium]|nr:M23 family metallopeptidase [Blastocatellia bacterium]